MWTLFSAQPRKPQHSILTTSRAESQTKSHSASLERLFPFSMGHSFQRGEEMWGHREAIKGRWCRNQQPRTRQTDFVGNVGLGDSFDFLNQNPLSVFAAPHNHSSEQRGKTKTAVPAGGLRCSHSSATLQGPQGHQICRRMSESFVSQPEMPRAPGWIALGSCRCQ